MSFNGSVEVLPSTAEWLDDLQIIGDVPSRLIQPESAAWLIYVLKHMPDGGKRFPHGKWATIQSIESQVEEFAKARAEEIAKASV